MAAASKKSASPPATKTAAKTAGTSAAAAGAASAPSGGDSLEAAFEAATKAAKATRKKPDNATLLKLYSYFKQATEGDVTGDRPGGFDFVGGAKYDAWVKLKGMARDEAMQAYVKQVERLNRE